MDDLSFMPEMTEFCGRRFRVLHRAEKTCVEYPGLEYKIREFRDNNVVVLDMPRCTGAAHDGCGRACVLFWKAPWLQRVAAAQPENSSGETVRIVFSVELKIMSAPGRYFCQSTEIDRATQPLTRGRIIHKCVSEVLSGSRGVLEMMGMVLMPIWRYYVAGKFERRIKAGTLKQTPVANLNLKPGELVQIKSEKEILTTLDRFARHRGLSCDRGMRTFCGGTYQVKGKLERMISESTGEMRQVESTVLLEGLKCLCRWNHVGGCPREDYMYWCEIWLKPVEYSNDKSKHL